jgi:hypothetical protein
LPSVVSPRLHSCADCSRSAIFGTESVELPIFLKFFLALKRETCVHSHLPVRLSGVTGTFHLAGAITAVFVVATLRVRCTEIEIRFRGAKHDKMANHNNHSNPSPPILLSIAGFDPSCGAGTAADLKTFSAHGCYGVAAITSLTVQNSQGVQ